MKSLIKKLDDLSNTKYLKQTVKECICKNLNKIKKYATEQEIKRN